MDLITLTQAKNYANKVAAGFSSVEVNGTNINFTLNDGSKATVIVPVPADGKDGAAGISVINLSIDTDGSLLCHMSDGSIIDAGHVPTIDPDLSKYYTKEEINSLFGKTFLWDGLSSEENTDNLSLFDEFYVNFVASEGKTRLLAKTPNAQNPIYMNADVQVDPTQGDKIRLTVRTFLRSTWSVDYKNTEYNLFSYYANIIIENEKCIEVSELELNEDKLNFLSTTENYDGYYSPAYEGSPVSKGYMVKTLKEGKYSISPDQLEKEFQRVLTEPVITIDSTDSTRIEFISYEAEENGKYGFTLKKEPWGDDYVSTNGAHDNSYALGKFILNNPGEKTIRVSINYSLECKSTDTAVFSKLDTTVAANSWNDSENAYKVITGETSTSGSVMYDLPSGQHFVTFKYMVGWKSTGEGENDALTVSFGYTQGAVQEHYLSTQQFVKDYVTGEIDSKLNTKVDKIEGKDLSSNDFTDNLKTKLEGLSNYNDTEIKTSLNSKANSTDVYTKSEVDNKISSIYKYKGSVANKEALPTENLTIGDVYNLEDTGMNVAYTGEKWDELGANIDLSSYYTKTEVNELPLIKGLKYNTTKNSLYTNAIGQSATASGYHSIALGPLARAKGNRSVAIGHDCHADKDYSTAIGYQAVANGTNSVAVGDGAVAHGDNQIALGQYNAGDEINLLVVGNGTSSTTRSNAHTLSKKGVAWFKGDIYTGGTSISGATKLAKVTELDAKVDKVEGKGLSTNDFTDDLNTKLAGIAAGAEVNTISTVKLNGEALTVTDKSVNIEVPIPQAQSCDVPYDAGNLPISVVNGANGFTQNQKSFSAIASSGTTYETTITVNKENISTIVLSASLAQYNSNNQTSTKFIETGCVAKIEFLYQGQSQTIKEVSTIGQSVLIEGAINGMQIKLTLQCSDNSKNVMFKVNIENYCINETLNNTLTISDSGDMYLQNILKQKTAELQTQIDWINNDTSKDIQVVPLYDTQASANLTMLNNTEYRIETHSGTSTLNINFEEGFETVDTATYKSVLILRTGTNDNDSCTVTVPDGVILQGDDVTNNILTTQKLKIYEISFNWHGFMMVGLVKGFSYPAPLA